MKIFDKRRDEMYILFGPDENLSVGHCLDVNGILVQVIDIQYANLPGVLEHLLRKSLLEKMLAGEDAQPNLGGELDVMTDYRLAVTKIRGTIREGRFRPGFFELCADRSNAQIRVLQPSEILELLGINGGLEGFGVIAGNGEPQFPLRLNRLGITLITGMKGSGKSYSAKKLLLRLIDAGKVVVVFDINGEYAGLGLNESGERNRYAGRIKVLVPKEGGAGGEEVPLRIPLRDITYEDFADFMGINGETQMYNELIVYWSMAREFTLGELEQWVRDRVDCDYVKLGLLRKIKTARALKLFGEFDLKGLIRELEKSGGALVVKLKGMRPGRSAAS